MRRAITLVMMATGCSVALANDAGPGDASVIEEPRQPPVARDSREVFDRCSYEESMAKAFRKNVVAYPRDDVRAKLAEWEAKLSACQDRAVAAIEKEREQMAIQAAAAKERAAAQAMELERYNRILADPTAQRTAFSALLCAWSQDEKEALHQVAEYRKAAKIGGVLNLTEVNNWQEEVVRARQHTTKAKIELARREAKPLACTHPWVARVAPCMTDEAQLPNACGPDTRAYVAIARGNE